MNLAARTHPRTAGWPAQVAVLLAAVLAGLALGGVLLAADKRSWSGARETTAVVTGVRTDGISATADGREVLLHLEQVPANGTRLEVELSPDGRARLLTYKQTFVKASRDGLALSLLLTVLLQGYRYAVTRKSD